MARDERDRIENVAQEVGDPASRYEDATKVLADDKLSTAQKRRLLEDLDRSLADAPGQEDYRRSVQDALGQLSESSPGPQEARRRPH